jgi:uncharacterized repeat protein (TIGR03803 family)
VLYRFAGGADGALPRAASLITVNGVLYGTTTSGGSNNLGTVFAVTPSGAERVLHSFAGGSDGSTPTAALTNLRGTLYGTTSAGGAGFGTVFSITPAGKETVLYRFAGGTDGADPAGGLVSENDVLYGTTWAGGGSRSCGGTTGCGTVFSITPTGTEQVLHVFRGGADGKNPQASLIVENGLLLGTSYAGGPYGLGTIFSLRP